MQNILVTGANRGLGLALVQNLIKTNHNSNILMGVRDLAKGAAGLEVAKTGTQYNGEVSIVHMDLSDPKSFGNLAKELEKKGQQLSVLVNNAAVQYQGNKIGLDQAKHMMTVNVLNQKALVDFLIDNHLFEENSKVLNMASTLGVSSILENADAKQRAQDIMCYEDIEDMINYIYKAISNGENLFSKKAVHPYYLFTKYLMNKYSHLLGRDATITDQGMQVYAVCPGWVKTDMGGSQAPLSPEEGVTTQRFLIDKERVIDPKMQGKLIYNKRPVVVK